MVTRDAITEELLAGATPAVLARKYPRKSVYRIYNELLQSGQLPEQGVIVVDEGGKESQPFTPAPPTPPVAEAKPEEKTGAQVVSSEATLPIDAVNRIRGILGISMRPKVLSMPTPELLYPAMVIAVTELGFKPMRPDDFIDTVLYQWLEACDIVPYAFLKRSELEEMAKGYGIAEEDAIELFREKYGLMTAEEFAEKFGVTLPEEKIEEETKEDVGKVIGTVEIITTEECTSKVDEPHKPTVGDMLKSLHIDNIRKEVEESGSSKCAESSGSQGNFESGE